MTAEQLITNLSNTSLRNMKISDLTIQDNKDTLLELLNLAKDKIAEDTLLWLGGEQVTMVTDTYEYTLTATPIQIIDVYDDEMYLRPRNSIDYLGYYQTSPNKIKFNNIENGKVVNINYYETPPDLLWTEEIVVPATLLSAIRYYITHLAFDIYKEDSDIAKADSFYNRYVEAVNNYRSTSDSSDVDTVISLDNKIWKRGIR